MDVVPSIDVRDTVSESLTGDLGRYQKRMKLNESKTKTMIVSRSRTMYYQSPPFTIGGNFLKESDDIVTLGVTFDPLFLKRTVNVMAPRLSVVFRRFVRLGRFSACWRQTNVTQIPKGPRSSSVANYRPISITSVSSKVFERLVSVRLLRFLERSGVLPTTQFAYRNGLGTCDALLSVSHTLQSALESGE